MNNELIQFIDQSSNAVFLIDDQGIVLYANAEAGSMSKNIKIDQLIFSIAQHCNLDEIADQNNNFREEIIKTGKFLKLDPQDFLLWCQTMKGELSLSTKKWTKTNYYCYSLIKNSEEGSWKYYLLIHTLIKEKQELKKLSAPNFEQFEAITDKKNNLLVANTIVGNVLQHLPYECYLVNSSREIIYYNRIANLKHAFNSTLNNSIKTIDCFIPCGNQIWFRYHSKIAENKGVDRFKNYHINATGGLYPVMVTFFPVIIEGQHFYSYQVVDNSKPELARAVLLRESKMKSMLVELSNEVNNQKNISSIALLARQYALEITESSFCFIAYDNPLTKQMEYSVYSDSEINTSEYVPVFCEWLNTLSDDEFANDVSKNIEHAEDLFIQDKLPLNSALPFDRFYVKKIFSEGNAIGWFCVAGKRKKYLQKDARYLKSIINLFCIAYRRFQDEYEIYESKNRLELAMDVAQMGVLEIVVTKNQLKHNENLAKILGFPENKRIDLDTYQRLIHPDDLAGTLKEVIGNYIGSLQPFEFTYRMLCADGNYKWFHSILKNDMRDSQITSDRIIGVQINVDEQLQYNERLRQALDMAHGANKAKSAFVANISHELKTPLNSIVGFTDILNTSIKDKHLSDIIHNIKSSSAHLLDLVNNLLDFSKLDAGKLELKLKPVRLNKFIKEIYEMFQIIALEKNLILNMDIDHDLPKLIMMDELRFRQVLVNLLSNAIKFTETGQVDFELKVKNRSNSNVDLQIKVRDTGIGISPEYQERIFEDFVQQDWQDNKKYGGTGLGLGIVKQLVNLMGGEISLESKVNKGSLFTVSLNGCETPEINEESFQTKDNLIVVFGKELPKLIDFIKANVDDDTELVISNTIKHDQLNLADRLNVLFILVSSELPGERIKQLLHEITDRTVKFLGVDLNLEFKNKNLPNFNSKNESDDIQRWLQDWFTYAKSSKEFNVSFGNKDTSIVKIVLNGSDLENEMFQDWEVLQNSLSVKKVREFTEKLEHYATEKHNYELKEIANELVVCLKQFNIENMKNSLKKIEFVK